MVNISKDKPLSSLFLVSDKIQRYLDTHNAISEVWGHNIVKSLSSSDKRKKFGIWLDILPKKQFRFKEKVLHNNIACFSSSTLLLLQ